MASKTLLRLAFLITIIGFLANFIWENLQVPLYGYRYRDFFQHFPMCLFAAIGDVVLIMLFYAIIAWYRKNWLWIEKVSIKDILILLFMGGIGAIVIEQIALPLDVWSYSSGMPIIPILDVGVTPIVQMMILPFVTFRVVDKLMNHYDLK